MEEGSSFGLDAMLGWLAEGPISASGARDELFAGVDIEDVVARALAAAPKPTVRRRSLPDDVVLWIIVSMAIFRQHSLVQLTQELGVVGDGGGRLASSSISEARMRLGARPLKVLFEELSMRWGHDAAAADRWHDLSVYAFDGTTLTTADSEENDAHFGRPSSRDGRSGYPKTRLVGLLAVRPRLFVDAAFGPYSGKGTGETTLAATMWDGLPDHSVLLFDRGFIDTAKMHQLATTGQSRHFVTREAKKLTWNVSEPIAANDALIDVQLSRAALECDESAPETLRLRRIEYQVGDGEPSALFTSLLCPQTYPAQDIVELYHERWDLELAYRDIKQTQLQRLESLRSRTPDGVEQEIWGLLTAYQLVRQRMLVVARDRKKPPARLSFKTALLAVQGFCLQMTVPLRTHDRLSFALGVLDSIIASGLMPPRRVERRYPRHVKVKMSNYKRNRGKPRDAGGGGNQ